ncbi:MAG: flagellar biosynthesis anti-sigma factor FlgM [Acidobacteria bacterium]|nr:flagellar biosynthesis anti-sigma factor FlgM [Acidobacteriota bacterium]
MANKINIDKPNGFGPIRANGQSDVKKSSGDSAVPVDVTRVNKVTNGDKVEFSNRATEVGKFVKQVKNMPDVRQDKINQLRDQISSGNYNPSSEEIADAILKDENI